MVKSKTIVLLHGMFVNNNTWSEWEAYFLKKGFKVYAPPSPGHGGDPYRLRKTLHPELVGTGFVDVVTKMAIFIDRLPEKPLVIGHSMAGLAVQKLMNLNKVSAAVSISGAPPKNVLPPFSTVKMVWPAVTIFSRKRYYLGSREWYNRAFFNTLQKEEQDKAYDLVAVTESKKIGRETLLRSFSKVDFKKPHQPILFIGGGNDAIFPPELTKKIAGKYTSHDSKVDVKIFDDKSHYICGEKGWEEVADYILNWYENL
ncbi:alpha/beta hydrolase [Flavobacterium fluviatile]|uniref:alpha/beta hydrolase n=1 Tax=Flavobacterium fluviatile TaxID=1862387 RepID=UPI0013D6EBBC|nr:alpha/beta hydrolase [Flavobacterium fluviatile]